ncbi:Type 1 glutamine amidotransferase-like domain-containing protein [Mangrovibacillus cuniculi]|uniref:Type 1 glutamine amidotransferase-like domain-containing protein n=1 Tax=Mangrovibacillus cuniculi TaxID=2593652 RepID=A0A7S8CBI7_9BACI|nr:Type 1 glutamine amidotransferase-like domain-containing protein [Mangrovibacillus cuniculi]QPC46967.1 type 1 glutamine amidotransferase-like domain-containing protein [Mangrovibacillus cuniculi]
MKTHYYLGWFNNYFPDNLSKVLQEDITERKSLAMISADPSIYENDGATERSWLDHAGIMFEEYHLINYRVQKEEAQAIIENASVIFLLGGDILKLHSFLEEYELSDLIKKSYAVVLGASAGAINMSAKWLCSKNIGDKVEVNTVYEGIGLDIFSILSHFDLENNMELVQSELSVLSEEIDIYVSNKDCALRTKGDKIDVIGDIYLLSNSKFQKLDETF